ncbi:MAG: ABC transporter permease [bacterium]
MLIIGLTGWTGIARLVRAEFLRLKRQDFVQAAIALGLTQRKIIFRHVMPNALGPVFVSATFGVAGAILIEASLSFLGLGPATAPSWGQILTAGRETGKDALILAPGIAIFLTVSLLNLVGEGARDALDQSFGSDDEQGTTSQLKISDALLYRRWRPALRGRGLLHHQSR